MDVASQGFGYSAGSVQGDDWAPEAITGGASRNVCYTPMSGLMVQSTYIPLNYVSSIVIELELAEGAQAMATESGYSFDFALAELRLNRNVCDRLY